MAGAVLRAPLETCLARANGPDAAAIERGWRQFVDARGLQDHAIDAGEREAEEVAAEVRRRLEAGELAL